MAKFRVRMTEYIEFSIEAENEDDALEYLQNRTIAEVTSRGYIPIEYDEEIICPIREDSECEISIV